MSGDPPCWAHLLESDGSEADAPETAPDGAPGTVVANLGACPTAGISGAVWSLPHGGDLDANLVRLGPGETIAGHVNDQVDVLLFVQSGRGELTVDGRTHRLAGDILALVPRGAHRTVAAGPDGITYLSIHRRRGPLTIGPHPQRR